MDAAIKILLAVLGCGGAALVSGRTADLKPAGELRQEIRGIGFTPAPTDWDGVLVLRNKTDLDGVYDRLPPTVGRVILGGTNVYRGGSEIVRESAIVDILAPQIAALRDHGVRRYVLSIVSPPTALKRYRALRPNVDGDENPLSEANEGAFAVYLCKVIEDISRRQLPMPTWVCFQAQPDTMVASHGNPPTAPEGAPYAPDQWIRMAAKLQAALAARNLPVAVLGPEASSLSWLNHVVEQAKRARWTWPGGISFNGAARGDDSLALYPALDRWLNEAAASGRGIWVIAPSLAHVADDRHLLVETFLTLRSDLLVRHANYWLWRYGFTWEENAEGLFTGRSFAPSVVAGPLRYLLGQLTPGARVFEVSAAPESDVKAIGFALGDDRVVVAINGGARETTVRSIDPDAAVATAAIFATDRKSGEPKRVGPVFCTIDIPPYAVAIVTVRRRWTASLPPAKPYLAP